MNLKVSDASIWKLRNPVLCSGYTNRGNKQQCLKDMLTILKYGSLQKGITAGVTTTHLCFKAVTAILLVYFLIWSQ